ncbi:MAG TPA: methyltransferase domain-containing protein [Solirubrobacterales bacterium]|nr:methyltransferase domain-containing protein [Solirubrobacterales bacterium]
MADWDADTYDRVSDPQEEWGLEVLARLELDGGEAVLDAGCGTGRVTRHLLERLPSGRVIGVDASRSMIERARENLADFGDRVDLRVADLRTLELERPVDAIFSNATFHWILDHETLFSRLHATLRPGGALEAQCGGEGNVAEWKRAIEAVEGDERFAPYLRGVLPSYYFASVGDTWARLERVGFEVGDVWLEERTVSPREPRDYVRSVGSAELLERLPERLHDEFVDALLGSMARPLTLHYVRLNISARRPGSE